MLQPLLSFVKMSSPAMTEHGSHAILRTVSSPALVPPHSFDPKSKLSLKLSKTGDFGVALSLFKAMIGAGLFATAWAWSKIGIVGAPILLFAVSVITTYSNALIVRVYQLVSRDTLKKNLTYVSLVEYTFGKWASGATTALLILTTLGSLGCYIIFNSQVLNSLAPKLTQNQWGGIISLIVLPLCLMDSGRAMAIFSLIGNLGVALVTLAVFWRGAEVANIQPLNSGAYLLNAPSGFLQAFGVLGFVFAASTNIIPIQRSSQKKDHFMRVMLWTMLFTTLFVWCFAWVGYTYFGSNVCSIVILNLGGGAFSVFAKIAIVVDLIFTFPVAFSGMREILERLLFSDSTPHLRMKQYFCRFCVVAASYGVSFAPGFGTVVGFVGGWSIAVLAFIIPCAMLLKLRLWHLREYRQQVAELKANQPLQSVTTGLGARRTSLFIPEHSSSSSSSSSSSGTDGVSPTATDGAAGAVSRMPSLLSKKTSPRASSPSPHPHGSSDGSSNALSGGAPLKYLLVSYEGKGTSPAAGAAGPTAGSSSSSSSGAVAMGELRVHAPVPTAGSKSRRSSLTTSLVGAAAMTSSSSSGALAGMAAANSASSPAAVDLDAHHHHNSSPHPEYQMTLRGLPKWLPFLHVPTLPKASPVAASSTSPESSALGLQISPTSSPSPSPSPGMEGALSASPDLGGAESRVADSSSGFHATEPSPSSTTSLVTMAPAVSTGSQQQPPSVAGPPGLTTGSTSPSSAAAAVPPAAVLPPAGGPGSRKTSPVPSSASAAHNPNPNLTLVLRGHHVPHRGRLNTDVGIVSTPIEEKEAKDKKEADKKAAKGPLAALGEAQQANNSAAASPDATPTEGGGSTVGSSAETSPAATSEDPHHHGTSLLSAVAGAGAKDKGKVDGGREKPQHHDQHQHHRDHDHHHGNNHGGRRENAAKAKAKKHLEALQLVGVGSTAETVLLWAVILFGIAVLVLTTYSSVQDALHPEPQPAICSA